MPHYALPLVNVNLSGFLCPRPLPSLPFQVHAQTNSIARLQWQSLWRGAAMPMATAGAIQSINLGLFDAYKRLFCARASQPMTEPTPLPVVAGAAASAGLSICLLTAPMTHIKVVQQLRGGEFLSTARALSHEGILFRGLGTTALLESCRRRPIPLAPPPPHPIPSHAAPPGPVSDSTPAQPTQPQPLPRSTSLHPGPTPPQLIPQGRST